VLAVFSQVLAGGYSAAAEKDTDSKVYREEQRGSDKPLHGDPVVMLTEADRLYAELQAKTSVKDSVRRNKLLAIKEIYEKTSAVETAHIRERALLGLARCLYGLGEYWEAFLTAEKSLPQRFDIEEVGKRLELEWRVALSLKSLGDKPVPGALDGEKKMSGLLAASRVSKAIVYNNPRSELAAPAMLMQADCLAEIGASEEAETAYRDLIKYYPKSREAGLGHAGLAGVLSARRYKDGIPHDVIFEVEQLLTAVNAKRQEAEASGMLEKANFHLRRRSKRDRNAAVFILKEVVDKFPGSESARKAGELLNKLTN
jgi:tetratricopeptide (TPR) repeat protein